MSTVLVIGSGGREHALAWKLAQSSQVNKVIVAPGNDSWPRVWTRWRDCDLKGRDGLEILARRAKEASVDLAVIGPDQLLALGIVDVFSAHGILAFGPTAEAARIESSKSFAKELMRSTQVPTASFVVAKDAKEARRVLSQAVQGVEGPEWLIQSLKQGRGVVLKLDGLALGKGVRVCSGADEAMDALEEMDGMAGTAVQSPWVIEERLRGEEISWLAFCDGQRCALMEPARDYKRVGSRDVGQNTGGMGAFSPVPGIPRRLEQEVRLRVFEPVLREMHRRGTPFRGVLYAGIMWDAVSNQFWVLEFNARFGDPETQVLLARLQDDLYTWCKACAEGDILKLRRKVKFSQKAAVVVIGAAPGYPGEVRTGALIEVPRDSENSFSHPAYFWAGVKAQSGTSRFPKLVVSGGRVVGAVGVASSLKKARGVAYQRIRRIHFEGMHYRDDIAEVRERRRAKREPVPIAVLASGRGSNFEAICAAIQKRKLDARIVCLITDRPEKQGASVLKKAKRWKVPSFCVEPEAGLSGANRSQRHEKAILKILSEYQPRFLVLAGYMRLIGPTLLRAFQSDRGYSRVVNIHPSLLPAFPGIDSYRKAFEYGAKVGGVTVHLVDEGVDSGPICAQQAFEIDDCTNVAQVERRGLSIEHMLYPTTLKWVLPEEFEFCSLADESRRKCVRPN